MELLRLFTIIIIMTGIGWNTLYLVAPRRGAFTYLERLALSYGLGLGLLSLEMLLFYFFKFELNPFYILLPWILIFIAAIPFCNRIGEDRRVVLSEEIGGRSSFLAIFLPIAILAEVIYAFFRALIKPLESYDAIAIYAIKSKIIYVAKTIPHDFFANTIKLFPHPDYPLNIPLNEAFGYIVMGSWNDQLIKVIFPLFFLALLALCYSSIRRFASRTYALLFTFLVASVPQLTAYATNGYLDLVLSYYCFASAAFLFLWFQDEKNTRFLIISAVMAGLAGWTKNEGLLYCMVNAVVLGVYLFGVRVSGIGVRGLKRWNYVAVYVIIFVLINLPWMIIKVQNNIANSEIYMGRLNPLILVKQLYKIPTILYEFQKEFFGPKKWNILWPIALLTILFNYKKALKGVERYISLSLVLIIGGYILFYMVSVLEVRYAVSKTWSRFLLHFLPVVVYLMARLLKDEVKV